MAATGEREIARRLALAVKEYNDANPDNQITGADIRAKDRGKWTGIIRLWGEGLWDGLTDQLPEDAARLFRHGEIGSRPDDWREKMIERQRRDRAARVPSYQEATGDQSAIDAYRAARDLPTNIAAGLPGAIAGALIGGPPGSALGGAATTAAIMGSIAKDRFIEDMRGRFEAENGRAPTRIEAAALNGAANERANEYAREQALKEGAAQFGSALAGGLVGRGAVRAIGGMAGRAGFRPAAATAAQGLGFLGIKGAENIAGESLSPDREFDGRAIYRGLDFAAPGEGGRRMEIEPGAGGFYNGYIRKRGN